MIKPRTSHIEPEALHLDQAVSNSTDMKHPIKPGATASSFKDVLKNNRFKF